MTKQWIRRVSAMLCGAMLCAGAAQANACFFHSDIATEQGTQDAQGEPAARSSKDYRITLSGTGREKEFCRKSIWDATNVTVTFKMTSGTEKVRINIHQKRDGYTELVESEILSIRDAVSASIDGEEFYITAEVVEGTGGMVTFQVSWT